MIAVGTHSMVSVQLASVGNRLVALVQKPKTHHKRTNVMYVPWNNTISM